MNGCFNGTGDYQTPQGDRYVGQWGRSLPNGTGTYSWPDGARHEGGWRDGVPSGSGPYFDVGGGVLGQFLSAECRST